MGHYSLINKAQVIGEGSANDYVVAIVNARGSTTLLLKYVLLLSHDAITYYAHTLTIDHRSYPNAKAQKS
jgi:hypothetical protein